MRIAVVVRDARARRCLQSDLVRVRDGKAGRTTWRHHSLEKKSEHRVMPRGAGVRVALGIGIECTDAPSSGVWDLSESGP